jgi:hypothetical protein
MNEWPELQFQEDELGQYSCTLMHNVFITVTDQPTVSGRGFTLQSRKLDNRTGWITSDPPSALSVKRNDGARSASLPSA